MNNYLIKTSKSYKICSKYFNKNQILIWKNLFGSLTQLKQLLELKLSHNLPIDFLRLKEINRKKIKNDKAITLEKYIIKYEYKAHKLYKEYVKSKCKGWRQPGINHDFKSLEFCIKKFGNEKGKEVYKQRCFDCGKPLRIQYFIDKGLSEDEAKIALKERQATFSLEKCIEKYSEIEGIKRWKERQIKWQNTLNSKPIEEKLELNKKKNWCLNKTPEEIKAVLTKRKTGAGSLEFLNLPCNLYYIKFYNEEFETWKIGITINTVEKRFGLKTFEQKYNLKYKILFVQNYKSVDEAYSKEQYILNAFNENRVYTNYNGFSTTETFNKDVLEGYYETNIQTNS